MSGYYAEWLWRVALMLDGYYAEWLRWLTCCIDLRRAFSVAGTWILGKRRQFYPVHTSSAHGRLRARVDYFQRKPSELGGMTWAVWRVFGREPWRVFGRESWRELGRESWRVLGLCWMAIMLSGYLMHPEHRWEGSQNLSVPIYVQPYRRFSALPAVLSPIGSVAEDPLPNWPTPFPHALAGEDSGAHSLDRYHYRHIQVSSTLLCQASSPRSPIFLLRLLRLYRPGLAALWPWAVRLLGSSTLLCQASSHRSPIFLLHLLRLYRPGLAALWAWAVRSQTMGTASEPRLYFWIAKIASSSYWLCVLLSESARSGRRRGCIY